MAEFSLERYKITKPAVLRNASPAVLYEEALTHETGSAITSTGALVVRSGEKTGRSPDDKRIVEHPDSAGDIWWGEVNIKLDEHTFSSTACALLTISMFATASMSWMGTRVGIPNTASKCA